MTVVQTRFELRRGTAAEWTAANPILLLAEPGYETDTRKCKVGDGATAWNALAYAFPGGLTDGDKGDITVSSGGTTFTIDSAAVTYSKIQNVSATDKILGRSSAGAGPVQEITCTAAGRALIDDADAAAQRVTLSLVPGIDVQAQDAQLAAIAGTTPAADEVIYWTGLTTCAMTSLTATGRTLIGGANASAMRTTLGVVPGTDVQAQDAQLAAVAGLTPAADQVIYWTGATTAVMTGLTSYGRSLIDDADAATARSTLGLGSAAVMATGQSGNALPIANGGATTWASDATFNTYATVGKISSRAGGNVVLTGLSPVYSLNDSGWGNGGLIAGVNNTVTALAGNYVALFAPASRGIAMVINNVCIEDITSSGTSVAGSVTASTWLKPGGYTIATLPAAGTAGVRAIAYASNGRRAGEGVGAGTGIMVWSDNTNWRTFYDNSVAAA